MYSRKTAWEKEKTGLGYDENGIGKRSKRGEKRRERTWEKARTGREIKRERTWEKFRMGCGKDANRPGKRTGRLV